MPQSVHWKNSREIALDEQNTITGKWHGCHSKKGLSRLLGVILQIDLAQGDKKTNRRLSEKGDSIG